MPRVALAALILSSALVPTWAAPPRCPDHTGIRWVLPFKAALERARTDRRLMLIKPIAGGTDDSGGW